MKNTDIKRVMRIIGGISIIMSPLILMLAFTLHFNSLPEFFVFKFKYVQAPIEETVSMLMGPNAARDFIIPHLIGYISVPFMIISSLAMGYVLFRKKPWFAFIGASLTCIGSVFLGGVFASWLSFAAIGNMPSSQIEGAVSAFKALTEMQGTLALTTYLSVLSLLGFLVLSIGLFMSRIVPKWSASFIFIGNLLIIAFMDLDNWMFIGAFLILLGGIPISLKLFKKDELKGA